MPTSLQDLHICVIGSGIGGLSTAISLLSTLPAASNTKVSIFEREPSLLARTGYGLTLTYDPSGPLASLDLLEACACADTPSRSHYLFSDSGHVLGYFGAAFMHPDTPRGQRGNMRVPRGKLRQLLYEKLRNLGGDVQWGKDLRTFAQDPGTLLHTLTFSDGSSILDCGLLVGADGVRSAVQKLLPPPLPPSLPTPPPRYTGIFLAIGTSTYVSPLTTERGFYTLDGNSRLFLMPFSGGALSTNPDAPPPQPLTMWQLSFNCPLDVATSLRSSPPLDLHNHILSLVASHHDPIHPLISETDPATVWGTPLVDRDPAPVTSSQNKDGRVVLLGDACHAMTPFKGQGCNQALKDGPLLASKLAKNPKNLHAAVVAFEREMIARTRVKVLASREAAAYLHSPEVLAAEEGFSGVAPENVPVLLATLRERGIGATTANLDDAIRNIIEELNFSPPAPPPPVIQESDKQAMLLAAREGDIQAVRKLAFYKPATLQVTNADCQTPLHLACLKRPVPAFLCVWLAKEMRLDPHKLDASGKAPLDYLDPNDDVLRIIKG